jgi:hypothetical protein
VQESEGAVKEVDRGIFTKDNPYGFLYDINHPVIGELYRRYKARRGLPSDKGISDAERRRFEWYISKLIDNGVLIVR